MLQEWIIRRETEQDFTAIDSVVLAASKEPELPGIIRQIRKDGDALLSLVAEIDSRIAGHILMCRLWIETSVGPIAAVGLAPLMVAPEYQNKGLGTDLTNHALRLSLEHGENIVLVLGHPSYYPRFGFSAALVQDLEIPFPIDVPGAFMGLELKPGTLRSIRGKVRYPQAFF
jgi:putative acetyltransferase